jgi:copper chaperone CopZ
MRKVDGVQSVQVSLKEGITTLELRPENRVTLAQLRTVIRNNGFVPKEVQVIARGSVGAGGFDVAGSGERLSTVSAPVAADGGQWRFTVPVPSRR